MILIPEPKLYLLRLGKTDCYKIGISSRPCQRLSTITCGRFRGKVEIVGVFVGCSGLERQFHRKFSSQRQEPNGMPVSGKTEWFRLSREDVNLIRTECRLWQMKQKDKRCRL